MRSLTSRITSSTAVVATATAALQRRSFYEYTVNQTQFAPGHVRGATMSKTLNDVTPKADQKAATAAAALTGSLNVNAYDEESMFNPYKNTEVEAKSLKYTANGYSAKYVVPAIDAEIVEGAVALFERFAKDTDQVELFFRKIIRNYPATVHIFGTTAEIAAFEAAEAAKIPNNKLIVGRVNAKATYKNIRDDIFNFYTTLIFMGAKSEQEIAAYAAPMMEKFFKDAFLSRHYLWRIEEELLRSFDTMPVPASNYEKRCATIVLERVVKATLNAVADLPWASEDYSCPTRGFDYANLRASAEAGMW